MEIQDFIKEALVQIFAGIQQAQNPAKDRGGSINPIGLNYLKESSGAVQHKATSRIGQEIEFDLAVVAQEEKGKKGRVSLGIPYLKTDGQMKSTVKNEIVNRVRFRIPVIFPKSTYEEENLTTQKEGE